MQRRGFTLIEVALSTSVVALLFVAAMQAATSARSLSAASAHEAAGTLLAQELLSEITSAPTTDPDPGGVVGGLLDAVVDGLDDLLSDNRKAFDSVDDYHGWTESPPQDRGGNTLAGFSTDWRRTVSVTGFDTASLQSAARSASDGRLIAVTVAYKGRTVATLSVIRTAAGDALWHGR